MFSAQRFLSILALVGMANAFNGPATFFTPGLGACGKTNGPGDHIVALPVAQYGEGGHCFKSIDVHYKGKSVQAEVVDKCPSCGLTGIDLSPSAFSVLAPESEGKIQVTWNYL